MGARKDKLPKETLSELCGHYAVDPSALHELDAFENFVFQYRGAECEQILRVTQSHHRQLADIQAELDWVHFLAERGVSIARPIPAKDGRDIVVSVDQSCLAVAWQKVPGQDLHREEAKHLWSPEFYALWGQTMGRLHRLSQDYQPAKDRPRRWHWSEDRYLHNWKEDVGPEYPAMTCAWGSTLEELSALPRESDYYGLIHADLHAKNFFWHEGQLQIFDTDDCQFNWFVADLASVFTSILLSERAQPDVEQFVKNFRQHFMTGYQSEFELPQEELARLPLFLRFRELLIFGALCHRWNFEALSAAQQSLVSRLERSILSRGEYRA